MFRTASNISVLVACAAALVGCSSPGTVNSNADRPPAASSTSPASDPVETDATADGDRAADPAAPGPTADPTADRAADPTAPDAPGEESPATSDSAETTGTPDTAGAADSDGPLEVPPTESGESGLRGLPGLSPAPSPAKPLLTRPLPARGTSRGRLVSGYPRGVLPAAPDSRIEVSSLSPDGRSLQVALTAGTPRGAGAVLLFYRRQLTALGFAEEPAVAVAGAQAAGFRRGQNAVTVSVQRVGGVSSYTLFATLFAG